ncbi:Glutathione S-transferase, N-terminal [Ostreococcus tauri]|uniref:Glutathione S-transferase n=1 Tax=Ostreococcus tauri TaxID=70448 RepID=Q012T3_OSTTA|nr:Glutathione S-transferase, N-terminal [Ostreococcus tauri]OUS47111.1 glutathione S-transferase [Ostreococcus tauri]CAL55097.1 Glutathione S-transferase, N-terminal [Ostreococcus tauri]|eukprot:XP_003080929.1 Glutathione S-transferase, N-terminal [Ostreococcus tauri]
MHARAPSTARSPVRLPHRRSNRPTRGRSNVVVRAAIGTLYDVPVSNNGARVRLLARWLNLYDDISVVDPNKEYAKGIKDPGYGRLNPQLKMPTMVLASGTAIPESEVICGYLKDVAERDALERTTPKTAEQRANAALAIRIHDVYLAPIQGSMYRGPMDRKTRSEQIAEIKRQLDVLEDVAGRDAGDFIAGEVRSGADAAIFPTLIFCDFLLPKYFGWKSAFGPNLRRAYDATKADADGAAVFAEVHGGLEAWEKAGRFEKVGVIEDVEDSSFVWAH